MEQTRDVQTENNLKQFSFPDGSFTFQYPEFKNWEVKEVEKVSENEYIIFLGWPSDIYFEIAPQIRISKIPEWGIQNIKVKSGQLSEKINPQGVPYDIVQVQHDWKNLAFFAEDFGVTITPISTLEDYGFSESVFFEEVIKTFTLKK